jgi:OOP family OmpA-OmpF porin
MASKKYTLLAAVLVMLQIAGNAQTKTDWGWDWKDSSKVPTKSIPQYNEFLNNQFPFPPKPRNAWELGLSLGQAFVIGDRPLFVKNIGSNAYTGGPSIGLSLRKAIGHIVSLRGSATYSNISIPQYSKGGVFVTSGSNTSLSLSLDALFSLNTISYYRANPKTNWYVLGGFSLIGTQVKARRADDKLYLVNFPNDKVVFSSNDLNFIHAIDLGAGVAFKLSPKWNLGIEQKFSVPTFGNDYLDGYKKAGANRGDFFSYSSIRLNMNLGVKNK